MATTLEILLKAKNDTDAAFKSVIKNLEQTSKETTKTSAAFSGLSGMSFKFNQISQALGAVAGFAKQAASAMLDGVMAAAAYADKLAALEDKTGLSAQSLQALDVAAKLGNASLEAVGNAVNKMQINIVNGSTAFAKLGLSLDALRKMSPEQQFTAVAKAIESINDPAQKAAARVAVFGKAGNELAGTMKAAAEGAAELGGALSNNAAAAAATLQDKADLLSTAWERVLLQFGASVAQSPEVIRALEDLTALAVKLAEGVAEATPKIVAFFDAMVMGARDALAKMNALWEGFKEGGFFGGLDEKWAKARNVYKESLQQMEMDSQDARERAKIRERQEEFEKKHLVDRIVTFSGEGADKIAAKEKAALERRQKDWERYIDLVTKESWRLEKEWGKVMQAITDAHSLGILAQHQAYMEMVDAQIKDAERLENAQKEAAKRTAQEIHEAWMDLAGTLFSIGDSLGGIFGGFAQLGGAAIVVSENWNVKLTTTAQKLQAIAGAAAGAMQAFNSGSFMGGAAAGASAGSAFGPWGAAIGAVGGALLGLFGKAKKAREEMAKLKNEFVSSMGGMASLTAKAKEAGIALDAMFKAKSAAALQAAITNIKAQLDLWAEGQDKIKEAMDEYGISVSEMGPRFAQQELDKQLAKIVEQYEILKVAGGDMNVITEKMGPKVLELVDQYRRAGIAIPAALRPVLQAMLENGDLVDENGVAFESLEAAGFQFAETMTDALKGMMDQIEKLVAVLARGFNVPVNFSYNAPPGGAPEPPGNHHNENLPGNAIGGWYPPGAPRLAWMGESGPAKAQGEFALPKGMLQEMLNSAAAMAVAGHGGGGSAGGDVFLSYHKVGKVMTGMMRQGVASVHPRASRRGRF